LKKSCSPDYRQTGACPEPIRYFDEGKFGVVGSIEGGIALAFCAPPVDALLPVASTKDRQ